MNNEIAEENIANKEQVINKKRNPKILLIIGLISLVIITIIGIFYYFFFYPNPQRILNKAIKNMNKVKDLHFEEIISETETNSIISKVTGDIIFPDKLRVNPILEMQDMENIIINNKVYTRWLDRWDLIEGKDPWEFNIYNPNEFLNLLNYSSSPEFLEQEIINDQKMFHIMYNINKYRANKIFFQEIKNFSFKGEVWVDKKDFRIYRIAITFIPEYKREIPLKYQMDFSDFNGDIKIEEPKI